MAKEPELQPTLAGVRDVINRVIRVVRNDPDLDDDFWHGYVAGLERARGAVNRAIRMQSLRKKATAGRE